MSTELAQKLISNLLINKVASFYESLHAQLYVADWLGHGICSDRQ